MFLIFLFEQPVVLLWTNGILVIHVRHLKSIWTWWHCFHRFTQTATDLPALVPPHQCHDLRLVQLHWSHESRSLVYGDELHRPLVYVHVLCSTCNAVPRCTLDQHIYHKHADQPDGNGSRHQRVDLSCKDGRRSLLSAVVWELEVLLTDVS